MNSCITNIFVINLYLIHSGSAKLFELNKMKNFKNFLKVVVVIILFNCLSMRVVYYLCV